MQEAIRIPYSRVALHDAADKITRRLQLQGQGQLEWNGGGAGGDPLHQSPPQPLKAEGDGRR